MKIKQLFCILFCAALILALLPVTARAATDVDIDEGGIYELSADDTTINVKTTDPVMIDGNDTQFENVQIICDEGANITLENVLINADNVCPLSFTGDGNKLALINENRLSIINGDLPGIEVKSGTSLEITGPGTLITNGFTGAGIGGGQREDAGTIKITGGTIFTESSFGAGIGGGGDGGDGGTVYISGGMVTARSESGAGIGGGLLGNGGNVYITGGSVKATSADGESIGNGDEGGLSLYKGTLMNKPAADGGVNVYLTTVTLPGSVVDAVTSLTTNASYTYGINDMFTDIECKLYLYLPAGTETMAARTTDGAAMPTYLHYTGSVTTADGGAAGALTPKAFAVTTNNPDGFDYDTPGVLKIIESGSYKVFMTAPGSTTSDIIVCSTQGVSLTLDGVSISNGNDCPLSFTGAGNTLTLVGSNTLISGDNQPGVKVEDDTELEINGPGALTARALEDNAAGIGGGQNKNGGTVIINGGTVTAEGAYGAGIGGGQNKNGGTVIINGGTVTAKGVFGAAIGGGTVYISGGMITAISDGGGAGIGGGWVGNGGNVCITGGSINAASTGSQSIGHGAGGSDSGTLMNKPAADGGVNVYLTKVTLESAPGMAVSSAEINLILASLLDAPYGYGTNDMYTDANGILYLWLPAGTTTTEARTAATRYTGSVETLSDDETAGTLTSDTVPPVVTGVAPSGTNAPVNGNIAVTFNEEMRTNAGAVSLDGGATALTGGSWNGGKTVYTVPYSGLSHGTEYTVTISGFKDYSGNEMAVNDENKFTTASSDASLAGLSLSAGTLSPVFDSDTEAYTASVANNVTSLTVRPTASDSNATIEVDGSVVESGADSQVIPLSVGSNFINIVVTAQDAVTQKTYTVTVTRASSPGFISAGPTYHTITAEAGPGGTISPAGISHVANGGDITYTITADDGYEIEDVLVDGGT